MRQFKAAFVLLVLALSASSIQAQNINDMVKWTSAQVIHYDVVAEYSGSTNVLVITSNAPNYSAQVKDRFEGAFDWNPLEMTMVGKPVFKNSPSTFPGGTPAAASRGKTCPQPRISGTYEHFEVLTAKTGRPGTNSLELSVKRTFPGGAVPYALEGACDLWASYQAKEETITSSLMVPPGLYLAMPQAAGAGMTIGKDGKSITFVDKTGWTYVYTLTIVK